MTAVLLESRSFSRTYVHFRKKNASLLHEKNINQKLLILMSGTVRVPDRSCIIKNRSNNYERYDHISIAHVHHMQFAFCKGWAKASRRYNTPEVNSF